MLNNNSYAELLDNSSAELYDNSSAKLWNNSSATLRDNSSAVLYDKSSAEVFGGVAKFFHKGAFTIQGTKSVVIDMTVALDLYVLRH